MTKHQLVSTHEVARLEGITHSFRTRLGGRAVQALRASTCRSRQAVSRTGR